MIIERRWAAARNSSSAGFNAYDRFSSLAPACANLIDVDQPLADLGRRCIGAVDQGLELGAGFGIAAFEPLAFAICEERRIFEGYHHGAAQGGEPIGWNAGRCAKRTAESERCTSRGQQRLVGLVLQQIKRERHILDIRM